VRGSGNVFDRKGDLRGLPTRREGPIDIMRIDPHDNLRAVLSTPAPGKVRTID
jgi:hypothetical protein